ncbi:PH domain-containing protein [Clostridium perfringens]|uniref:PH domain-containing protein n=1 Tax=Clostridium perfringens TaxID=1502 RepID=UPI002E78C76B|nr:PH domain-containing protein [Clostridium perfringens]WVH96971.1 PH domain-containing protein [Clostridium perfringens]
MEKKLSNKAIKSWILGRTIGLIVLMFIYLGIIFVLPKMDIQWADYILNNHMRIVNILSFIIIGITVLSAYIEPFFEYKQWSYRIDEEEIFLTEGVFFKRSVTIPIVRIQNINLSEGPVNRKFNLADVKIGTAGGSYNIPNLDKEEVEKIREFLRIKINENVREELEA